MKSKLLYPAIVILNLVAIYVMINFYSADYLYSNEDGASLKESTATSSLFVIAVILFNIGITAALLFSERRIRN